MTIKLKYKELVKYLIEDKEQQESLKVLAQKRDMSLKTIIKSGIFCVPDKEELAYLLETWGLSFEEAFGKDESDFRLLNEGFIIPVLDSSYNILFFVNYNWERGGARKYFNVYPDYLNELPMNMKMYGQHNLATAVKEDWIVVVEGVFDSIRLTEYGIPSAATMGTRFLEFQKRFLSRFSKVIYVSDADYEGQLGWRNFQKKAENAIHYKIQGLHKDVDEFCTKDPRNFEEWVTELKRYRPLINQEGK